MSNRIDPDSIGFLTADISRLIRAEFDRRIAEAGLSVTAGEARTLVNAARAGVVRQAALAEQMGIEAMTLSGYLDRLEGRRLIERQIHPEDRRAKLVALTGAADAVLDEIAAVAAAIRADASRDVSTDDWTRLLAMLKTVRGNLAAARPECARKEGRAA